MTASTTIDKNSILLPASTDTVGKTYADNASGFNDVFDTVSSTYKSDKADYSRDNKKANVEDSSDSKTVYESKKDDIKVDANKNKSSKETPDSYENNVRELFEKTEELKKSLSSESETSSDVNQQIEDIKKLVEQIKEQLSGSENQVSAAQADVSALLAQAETLLAALQQPVAIANQPINNAQVLLDAQIAASANSGVDIAKQNSPADNAALNNLKDPAQQTLPATEAEDATALQAANKSDDAQLEAPVIKVSTEAVSSEVATTDASKQNIKDAMTKTGLTQDMIDATGAKVVKVETNSSNSGMLKNQNAEEQAVKLSLQNPNGLTATDVASVQTGFDKAMSAVQTATQTSSREISQTEIMTQVTSKLANFKSDETTTVTIVLRPENLGKINLELVTSKEGLSAQFTAENAQVKEILDKNLNGLKESLSNQGVNVNNVTVKVAETQKQDTAFSFDFQNGQNNQQAQENDSANRGEFRASVDGDFENGEETEGVEVVQQTEKSVSINSHLGQVDYKV